MRLIPPDMMWQMKQGGARDGVHVPGAAGRLELGTGLLTECRGDYDSIRVFIWPVVRIC
ncbi:hypothetical protein EXIGLDRAFT_720030 [Exidia glandulosa HHB12029]|uniref:Uncharacterized protein n=1 Tax=Exidia glandulosa HHB12029 TaxID=1314781 RepID=A0A165NMP9_EXIGL|nr:hypothetical protein EXIGLDRAFT_720030 [Exidia glandulosa HHB12029]